MRKYQNPEVEVLRFGTEDIITSSVVVDPDTGEISSGENEDGGDI